jgi:MFS family permease
VKGFVFPKREEVRALDPGIWALGIVSLLMDISSELVHSLLPLFMTTVLGAGTAAVGLIEGVAEATASVAKVFSGSLSDRMGKRKPLAVAGYGLAALTKPMFALAGSLGWVFAARFTDRVGKGIRGAPRDALIADITPVGLRGAAYGLRQALDAVGAFLGPLLAVVFMALLAGNIQAVFWVACVPAFLAVAVLVLGVKEPEPSEALPHRASGPALAHASQLGARYWAVVGIGAVFTLARFSEAFLVLRAQSVGVALGEVPLVMVVMSAVYAAVSYPAGAAADRLDGKPLLLLGLAVLAGADFVLAAASTPAFVYLGAALWGVHMGLTQGLFSKLVADAAPRELRGTAFGVYNLVTGLMLLAASVLAGLLWSRYGAPATFTAGAVFAILTVLGLLAYRPGRFQPIG